MAAGDGYLVGLDESLTKPLRSSWTLLGDLNSVIPCWLAALESHHDRHDSRVGGTR